MITENLIRHQSQNWQKSLATVIRDTETLLELLELDPQDLPYRPTNFPLRVPHSYVAKMQKGDWHDPLLRQVLPLDAEDEVHENFLLDPVGDKQSAHNKGVLQKYHGRALILTTSHCPIHCRFCFRQHFPYHEHQAIRHEWTDCVNALAADNNISEVILSGGDPLSLSDKRLHALCQQLEAIPHIKRLRIHTRFPLVLPERIDNDFIAWVSALSLQVVMVIHANHANELQQQTPAALLKLQQAGIVLLNQSVLLKGVNDNTATLVELSNALIQHHVVPYYLHILDRVQGAAHFEVSEPHAIALVEQLRALLPGYMVPKLVREIAGEHSKTPLS